MPTHPTRLTDRTAAALMPPEAGYEIHWCPDTSGFAVRITQKGARTWIAERRVAGKKVRFALGRARGDTGARGTGAIVSAEAARKDQVTRSSELQQGVDRRAIERVKLVTDKRERVTFAEALKTYVERKRRNIDKLPLKERTKSDYLSMLDAPTERKVAGELYALAGKSIHKITAEDIRRLAHALEARGERRRTYGLQVTRAVLRWHGVNIEDNPFAPSTAGVDRVVLVPSRGHPKPIPNDRIGAWWKAAGKLGTSTSDQLRFQLLTGVRPGEAAGLTVGDFDLVNRTVVLADPKNRRRHVIYLSDPAAAIVNWHAAGRKPSHKVFGVADTQKTLDLINVAAGVAGITPHRLRHTFATIVDRLNISRAVRDALLNHKSDGVADEHYTYTEDRLREAWGTVADFIEAAR